MKIVVTTNANGTLTAKGGGKQATVKPATPGHDDRTLRANFLDAGHAVAVKHGKSMLPRTETVEVDLGKATFVLG